MMRNLKDYQTSNIKPEQQKEPTNKAQESDDSEFENLSDFERHVFNTKADQQKQPDQSSLSHIKDHSDYNSEVRLLDGLKTVDPLGQTIIYEQSSAQNDN